MVTRAQAAGPIPSPGAPTPAGRDEARLRRVAEEFESLMLAQLFKSMRGRIGDGGVLPMGQAERLMRDLQDEEMGRSVARSGGIGLAQLMLDTLRASRRE